MSMFWSAWVIVLTLTNIGLVCWVLFANKKVAVSDEEEPENKTTGHVYDGIEEYDNPLPKWWFQMFVATLIFAAIYLILYPGMGNYPGLLKIMGLPASNLESWEREMQLADEKYGEVFAKYAAMPVEEVAKDPKALKMGLRLYSNNCAVCHGSDAGGGHGFPNLRDSEWIWGGTPELIHQTLVQGRGQEGVMRMPAWGEQWAADPNLGAQGAEDMVVAVSDYVLKLAGLEHDPALIEKGAEVYAQTCVACHGADGKGNQMLGAPNLTDDIWLYNNPKWELVDDIRHTIRRGRGGVMPSQGDKLQAEKIHLLTAYVWSLSNSN